MEDRPEQGEKQHKKPYVKPEIQQVQLRPEEAVLVVCKTSTGGPSVGQPAGCGIAYGCMDEGS